MLFNSIPFLFVFLPITYVVYWVLRTKDQRYIWLALTGYVFYSFWNVKFCGLMLFSTLVSYLAGLGMVAAERRPALRKLFLVVPIVVDLSLLGFFKYANFVLESSEQLAAMVGRPFSLPALNVVLPVGISFYTFHTITYIVDSYRRAIRPTRNFFEFACYVSLFPQLVAGPIVRFRQVEADLENIDHAARGSGLEIGWSFFAIGMIKKVLVADTLAVLIDPALAAPARLGTIGAWLCMLGYTYQLYFDFSGYSDMAVGLGHLFGIRLPQNFNSPYKAVDVSDFWRRWHISLSTCLRDYLYIPLGGSRGPGWMVVRNLLITMLLGGLWHGAHWTFVIWGLYHGLLLVVHRSIAEPWGRLPSAVRRFVTFLLVIVGWVFFRAPTFGAALSLLGAMFGWIAAPVFPWAPTLVAAIAVAAWVAHTRPNTWELRHEWSPLQAIGIAALFAACLFSIYGAQQSPFLYFQF